MNSCEKYIIKLGGIIDNMALDKTGYFLNGKNTRIFIDSSMYEDRKRVSKKFKNIIQESLRN